MTATAVRRLTGLALLVAASLTLTGCGNVSAGAAAVIDGRRIAVADLQNATTQIQDIDGADTQIGQGNVLDWLVLEPWVVDLAARYGVGVSEDDARRQIYRGAPAYDPASTTVPHKAAAPETVRAVRSYMALQVLRGATGQLDAAKSQQALGDLQTKISEAKLDVNPRYLGETPNWLVGGEAETPETPGTPETPETTPGSDGGATPQPTATP